MQHECCGLFVGQPCNDSCLVGTGPQVSSKSSAGVRNILYHFSDCFHIANLVIFLLCQRGLSAVHIGTSVHSQCKVPVLPLPTAPSRLDAIP